MADLMETIRYVAGRCHAAQAYHDDAGFVARAVEDITARMAALSQPHPSAAPEGKKLVPVEPTLEILDAMRTDPDGSKRDLSDAYLRRVYHAAVSTPPAPAEREG